MDTMQAPARPGRRMVQTGPMKSSEAGKLRRLADQVDKDHPETVVGGHLRDAAKALERGMTTAASRHLAVARHTLTPQQLYRHGVTRGTDHTTARRNAGELDRRMLAVRDIHDIERDNLSQALERRQLAQQVAERKAQPSPVPGTPMRPGDRQHPAGQAGGPPNVPRAPQARSTPLPTGPREMANGPQSYTRHPDETVQCPVCHRWDAPDARFCDQCGNSLLASKPGYRPKPYDAQGEGKGEPVTCPNCGQGDAADARFCDQCGHQLDTTAYKDLAAWHHAQTAILLGHHSSSQPRNRHGEWVREGGYGAVEPAFHGRRAAEGFAETFGDSKDSWHSIRARLHPDQRRLYDMARKKGMGHYAAMLSAQGQVELSAQTGRLSVTPAPRGRPGGPGLYDVKGMGHTPYLQQIVKALIQKRGMPPGKAYAIARAAIRKWQRGGGHVHPEVQAAAARAEAGENARQARAKAAHGHSGAAADIRAIYALASAFADALGAIELTGTAAGAAKDPRTPLGQFGTGGASGTSQAASAKSKAQKKAALLKQAAALRAQAAEFARMLLSMQKSSAKSKAKAAASSKAATRAAASATKAGQTGKSKASTPAKKSAPSPASAARAKFHAATKGMSKGQQEGWLRGQIKALLAQARSLTAQAAKL